MGRRNEFNFGTEKSGSRGGRVGKDQFSIDGRSWDYRNPYNQRLIDKANENREKGRFNVNPASDKKFDALYDYDFGRVRDAAKELGIGNVNKKKEVKQILDYIQGARKQTESKDEKDDKKDDYVYTPVGDPPDINTGSGTGGGVPQLEGPSKFTGFTNDPSKDAIRAGDDLNDWYGNKFVPHLKAEADFGAEQMGADTSYFMDKMVYGPPELGDVSEIFKKYKNYIDMGGDDDDD